jgi:hypothetical protein
VAKKNNVVPKAQKGTGKGGVGRKTNGSGTLPSKGRPARKGAY